MKKNILSMAIFASFIIVLAGCTKDPVSNLTDDETRIYITHHDSTVNFSVFHTFSVADSVAVISNNQLVKKDLTSFDAQFIAVLTAAMQQRGFTLVDKNSHPDLGINVSRIYNDYTGVIDYSSYWGDYYGYWNPYYWGYPGYSYYFPSFYGVYSITTGALSADMFDLKDAPASNQLKNVWNGLVRGEAVFDPANINTHMKTLFDESAYIKTN